MGMGMMVPPSKEMLVLLAPSPITRVLEYLYRVVYRYLGVWVYSWRTRLHDTSFTDAQLTAIP